MLQKIRVVFSIPELRQKILLTLGLLAVYRIGWYIPLPIIDPVKMRDYWAADTSGIGGLIAHATIFSGSQLQQLTIFGLGIMPYISASIIFQLLATVYEPLKQLQKEGESGRKKINEYTRYATVLICLIQSSVFVATVGRMPVLNDALVNASGQIPFSWLFVSVLTMTAGSTFLMWLGEQIDEYGIGNGISMLIMAGIIAGLPEALTKLGASAMKNGSFQLGTSSGQMGVEMLILLGIMFVTVIVGVIFITKGQRRIPTQSAKHVRGRKTVGGTRQFLPLKVNQAGVMPIIFASSLLLFPQAFFSYMYNINQANEWWRFCNDIFARETFAYIVMFIGMIFFFCYFWTAVTFNPKDMADNLKNYGTFIPGYRPGNRTADYLEKVMIRITYVGASFLSLVAVLPSLVATWVVGQENYLIAGFFGGTSLLIVVSVIIDLVDKIDSHLVMRNYKGLLEKK